MNRTAAPGAAKNRRRKERLNHARRKEVIDTAARLFAERGFHGTSMEDIASELGILKGSLYHWIESKEALLAEIVEGSLAPTFERAHQIVAQDLPASERLRQLIHSHVRSWIENANHINVFMTEFRWLDPESIEAYHRERESLETLFKDLVRDGVARGEFNVLEREISIVVNGIFGVLNWFPRWYRADGWASPEHIADTFTGFVLRGVRA